MITIQTTCPFLNGISLKKTLFAFVILVIQATLVHMAQCISVPGITSLLKVVSDYLGLLCFIPVLSDAISLSMLYITLTIFSKFNYSKRIKRIKIHPYLSSLSNSLGRSGQRPCSQVLPGVPQAEAGTDCRSEPTQLSSISDYHILVFSLFCSSCFLLLIWLLSSQSLFSTVLQRGIFAIFQARLLAVLGLSVFA